MKQVLRTTDLSLVESLRIALEAAEIGAVVTGPNASGLPVNPVTVGVVDDANYVRALTILSDLQQTSPQMAASGMILPRRALSAFVIVILLIAAVFCLDAVIR